ncbi:zinc finger family protein [Striga asiatica]|uniref:Zinc finger family protein n=1 Tax=Striga asiatica TaxID=4170 RepID=A0A5A7Q375_STRAF|nr:zinc finger family protein [Striga asiatica]
MTFMLHIPQAIGRNGGEDTLAHWPVASGIQTIDETSLEVLKHLDKIWPTLSSSGNPVLSVYSGIYAHGVNDLSLYVHVNCVCLVVHLNVVSDFQILGVLGLQESLSVASARSLLSDLKKVGGYQRLNPNEFRAAVEILHFICDEKNISGISNWDHEAIVPDDGCRLVHAQSCVYIDSRGSHYVKNIDTSRLRFVHQDLPQRVCQALGIRKLSDVVKECLYTRFLLLPKLVDITLVSEKSNFPEWGGISQHRALYFIDESKTCVLIAEPPKYIAVTDVIAAVISHILDSPLPLSIGSFFLSPENSETALVDILKLSSRTRDHEFGGGAYYFLGKDILPQDASRVQFHPLRPFYKGEIVAWRSSSGERLKYGRVPENVKPSAGQALYRFMLEISPGITELILSSNIFSFKNISYNSEDSSAARQEGDEMKQKNTRAETSGGVGSGPCQVFFISAIEKLHIN